MISPVTAFKDVSKKPGPTPAAALDGFTHINRYWDKTNKKHVAKILPGEYYVTTHNELITTVLGSCISACIRDTLFGIGGMNHFMLPANKTGDPHAWGSDAISSATRYGNFAMEHLINGILTNGGQRKNLEVKIFGGGRIISQMTDVGANNIAFVREYIDAEALNLVSENVGDIFPRKVLYDPKTGKVKMKKLRSLHNDTIITRETTYSSQLDDKPVETGEIDLF
ncbi:MAG: chemoreceptor glutamine deamidase CheD [Sulfuriflexus sp.]|nr:chemoreceptor glutamine deamidase CheD [Sulfuriflexus sp.]